MRAFHRLGAAPTARLDVVGSTRLEEPEFLAYLNELEWLTGSDPRTTLHAGYVSDELFDRWILASDVVVLPYREIDQSGVLATALAFGRPLLLTAVGGFPEVAEARAAELVRPGDAAALHLALRRLIEDGARRDALAAGAREAAATRYSWDEVAARHLELYETLVR